MKRANATGVILVFAAALLAAQPAAGHDPGTYGGEAERLCRPVLGQAISVGATGVPCRTARRVAARRVRDGASFRRWRCPGTREGSAFGHCHGRGPMRGAIVHWAVND